MLSNKFSKLFPFLLALLLPKLAVAEASILYLPRSRPFTVVGAGRNPELMVLIDLDGVEAAQTLHAPGRGSRIVYESKPLVVASQSGTPDDLKLVSLSATRLNGRFLIFFSEQASLGLTGGQRHLEWAIRVKDMQFRPTYADLELDVYRALSTSWESVSGKELETILASMPLFPPPPNVKPQKDYQKSPKSSDLAEAVLAMTGSLRPAQRLAIVRKAFMESNSVATQERYYVSLRECANDPEAESLTLTGNIEGFTSRPMLPERELLGWAEAATADAVRAAYLESTLVTNEAQAIRYARLLKTSRDKSKYVIVNALAGFHKRPDLQIDSSNSHIEGIHQARVTYWLRHYKLDN